MLRPRLKAKSKVSVKKSSSHPYSNCKVPLSNDNSSKKSNVEVEVKPATKTTKADDASKLKVDKSGNFLISSFLKPNPGKASEAENNIKFYPPD